MVAAAIAATARLIKEPTFFFSKKQRALITIIVVHETFQAE
jgi:hypothetical protein